MLTLSKYLNVLLLQEYLIQNRENTLPVRVRATFAGGHHALILQLHHLVTKYSLNPGLVKNKDYFFQHHSRMKKKKKRKNVLEYATFPK